MRWYHYVAYFFGLRRRSHLAATAAGFVVMSMMLARAFGRLHGGNL